MIITAPLTGILQIVLPLILGAWFIRRYSTNWRLFGIGALLFVASQVVHLPLLSWLTSLFRNGTLPAPAAEWSLLFNAVVLGLMAGLCEETARLAGFHFLKDRARSWAPAVTLGLGHGGIESMIIGGLVVVNFVPMLIARDNPAALNLPADQLPALQAQLQAYWASPWYAPLAGLVERLGAIPVHLALSVLVLQTFLRRTPLFYILAVLWHTVVDGVSVYLSGVGWDVWAIEAVILGFGLASLGIVLALRKESGRTLTDDESLAVVD